MFKVIYKNKKEQLMNHVIKTDSCWFWTGSTNPDGYGRINIREKVGVKRMYQAHRISYEVFKGIFNKKLNVLHKCDVPNCVNPKHLFLGTQRDNIIDMYSKGKGFMRGKKKLTIDNIKEIMRRYKKGDTIKNLAEDYNRHCSTIRNVIRKRINK